MRKKIIQTGLAGLILSEYYVLLSYFKLGIPCIFHKITGLLCPGCGISRMIVAMIHLDFQLAYLYNPVIFVFSPLIIYFCIRLYIAWIKNQSCILNRIEIFLLYVLIITLLIFGIVRNL